jgi:site-specific recombinase XerD
MADYRQARKRRLVAPGLPRPSVGVGVNIERALGVSRPALKSLYGTTPVVFSEGTSSLRPAGMAIFSRMVERAAASAKLDIKTHAHMLRHACGYKLANEGHDTRALQAYLGHRNIQNTTRYTALAPDRFKGFWRD